MNPNLNLDSTDYGCEIRLTIILKVNHRQIGSLKIMFAIPFLRHNLVCHCAVNIFHSQQVWSLKVLLKQPGILTFLLDNQ